MFSLICTRINGWVNSREAGDLRCYLTHYDITIMTWGHGVGHLLQFHSPMCLLPLQILLFILLCMYVMLWLWYNSLCCNKTWDISIQRCRCHVTSMGNLIVEILAPYLQNQLGPSLWKYKNSVCSEKIPCKNVIVAMKIHSESAFS